MDISRFGYVSNQHNDNTTDDCFVRIIAEAAAGSAKTIVRCIYTRSIHRVHPSAVERTAS